MTERSVTGWNIAGFGLYVLLIPVAFYEFLFTGLAFGMSTDACYDKACDDSYHEEAAIATVAIGIFVVMGATLCWMVLRAKDSKNVFGLPFLALFALALVGGIGFTVLH